MTLVNARPSVNTIVAAASGRKMRPQLATATQLSRPHHARTINRMVQARVSVATRNAELCWGQRYIWLRYHQLPPHARHEAHIVLTFEPVSYTHLTLPTT